LLKLRHENFIQRIVRSDRGPANHSGNRHN
jgi:hypothetical protein